ncbi:MAG TPA: hypothetical protein VFD13_07545, partial [Candidatus Kapabacteria bacterium]|nr:hypothetical protein [Candidatus Kapabacteria bacterium]
MMNDELGMMKGKASHSDPLHHSLFLIRPASAGRWRSVIGALLLLCSTLSTLRAQNPELIRRSNPGSVPSQAAAHASQKSFSPVTKGGPIEWPKTLSSTTPWTAAGKEFYACFLPVVGSADDSSSSDIRAIFLSSRAPARVTIEVFKSGFRETVLVNPGTCTRVDIPLYAALGRSDYELA